MDAWVGRLPSAAVLLIAAVTSLPAQEASPDDSLASRYRLNLAVPDGPAFSLVEIGASQILRPSSVRDLTSVASDFTSDGKLTVPRSLGLELSPAMLIGGNRLKLSTYQRNPWLYRLRFSAAAQRTASADQAARFALGIRSSIIDDSDVRTDTETLDSLRVISNAINEVYTEATDSCPPPCTDSLEELLTRQQREQLKQLDADLKKILSENERWNARALDIALAFSTSSEDSLGNNLEVDKAAAWVTYAHGFGTWGQLLIGAQFASDRDTATNEFRGSTSLGSRMFFGVNDYKGFVEAEARWVETMSPAYVLNGGAELRLPWVMWTSFSIAVELGAGKDARLRTDFQLRFGFPKVSS